ncbi:MULTISPECIES: cell division protein FtsQ/DivIB [Prochlorococcus]|nr:Cell division protein FtsQ [Prochlorococcus marinus str. SS2]KGG24563.1 Cell division protein FtsQ [Prochlorococcus marinus str. SS35]
MTWSSKPFRRPKNSGNLKIKQIWGIICFFSITTFLGGLLVTKGREPINSNQIHIKGAANTPNREIVKAMGINLPTSLLEINPKQLENNLQKNLPIKAVAISRRIAPLGIDVQILEREPIAFALRKQGNNQEKGMVDKEGYWIPIINGTNESSNTSKGLIIDGWDPSKKDLIKFLLRNQTSLGSPLKRVIFNPNGNISLQTEFFKFVHLGNKSNLLDQQLKAIAQLSKSLPNKLTDTSEIILNLKNPSKPKLFLPNEKNN